MKVLIFLCALTLARGGIIATDYSPPSAISTVYSSLNAPVVKTITPTVGKSYTPVVYNSLAPAPVYENILATHESRASGFDGSHQTTFGKTLQTPFATINKFDSRTTNGGLLTHTVSVYSSGQVVAQPHATFGVASPVVHSLPSVTYTAHNTPVVTNTIASPSYTSFSNPTKIVTPSLSAIHGQPAVKITYSEAPLVSHMTFTGLGTSYSW